jgi:PhnB protein
MAFGPNPPKIQAHVCVSDGRAAIAFYENAFGAVCALHQMADDGRRVLHANLEMFGGEVMLHDEFPEFGSDVLSPLSRGGASMAISVNLPTLADVDAAMTRAESAGREHHTACRRSILGLPLRARPRPLRPRLGLQRSLKEVSFS